MQKLFIPIIEGTTRPKRESLKAAQLILEIGQTIDEIEVVLVKPEDYSLPFDGNDDENRDPKFTKLTQRADAFFIVTPEYNHSIPGTLKRLLDSEYHNYSHKPVAFAGVSNGAWGGTRAIEALATVCRQLNLLSTRTDVHFPNVDTLFDENGHIKDEKYKNQILRGFHELIWMAKTLKWGRENIPTT